jgi:hypothetical protein
VFTEKGWEQYEAQKRSEPGDDAVSLSSDDDDVQPVVRQLLLNLQGSYGKSAFRVIEVVPYRLSTDYNYRP